jgi:hypothetical protein
VQVGRAVNVQLGPELRGRTVAAGPTSLIRSTFDATIMGVAETTLIGAPSMNRTTPCHAHECTRCGGPTHEPEGAILSRLYPGALFCVPCGRLAARCECVA